MAVGVLVLHNEQPICLSDARLADKARAQPFLVGANYDIQGIEKLRMGTVDINFRHLITARRPVNRRVRFCIQLLQPVSVLGDPEWDFVPAAEILLSHLRELETGGHKGSPWADRQLVRVSTSARDVSESISAESCDRILRFAFSFSKSSHQSSGGMAFIPAQS